VARHRELQAFGRQGLSTEGQLNYDIAEFRQSVAADGARFRFGSEGGRPAPYVVSQLGGAYYNVPDFSTRSIRSRAGTTPSPICRGSSNSPAIWSRKRSGSGTMHRSA
jgi:uncharacterized protein (DUF885 family)